MDAALVEVSVDFWADEAVERLSDQQGFGVPVRTLVAPVSS